MSARSNRGAGGIRITIDASAAIANLSKIAAGIPAATKRGRRRAAEDGVAAAKKIVPVRTGRLQRSIGILAENDTTTTFGSEEHYAGFVDRGTSRRPAKPYLTPQYNRLGDGIAARYVVDEINRL